MASDGSPVGQLSTGPIHHIRYRTGRFTAEEDQLLVDLYNQHVESHKHNIFAVIEPLMLRNSKSLRERFCNHLAPDIDHSELNDEEKSFIDEEQEKCKAPSTPFSEIARSLSERNKKLYKGTRSNYRRTDLVVRNYLAPRIRKRRESAERIRRIMHIESLLDENRPKQV
ncbi:4433_t:CDS:1 [Acaulospora morrowiae]|uniref:4433_t:CDS:1 n=1 Tax=Acaulospora morrowiae TaxID=94023 RepID=A0A9N9GPW9_9GLOM|nr:4433_t:CDS:1 [Acaulospora morrowiae]